MKVLFFAQSCMAAGRDSHVLKVEKTLKQSEFWALLIEAFPDLAGQQASARLARHETYLQGEELLHPDDEIAVIPPVSGG